MTWNLEHLSASAVISTGHLLLIQNPDAKLSPEQWPEYLLWIGQWCDQYSWYWRAPKVEELQ